MQDLTQVEFCMTSVKNFEIYSDFRRKCLENINQEAICDLLYLLQRLLCLRVEESEKG